MIEPQTQKPGFGHNRRDRGDSAVNSNVVFTQEIKVASKLQAFGEVLAHYVKFELPDDQTNATIEKSPSTITKYKHYLNRWILPKWQKERALAVVRFK